MRKKVKNLAPPKRIIENKYLKQGSKVFIDFTKYPNWYKSVEFNAFTNKYKDPKDINNTLSNILFSLFPYIQSNINGIIANKYHDHCHLIDSEHYKMAKELIEKINSTKINEDDRDTIWYLGVKQSTRILAWIIPTDNNFILYPLAIDCNHLIYPDEKHNQKDYKKNKREIIP